MLVRPDAWTNGDTARILTCMSDPLGEALHLLRMSGTFYARCEFTAPWGLEIPPIPDTVMLHVMTFGRCTLEVERERCELESGDLVLVPHGAGHLLASGARVRVAKLHDVPREEMGESYEFLRHGGGGAAATMICAAVRFDHPAARQLVDLLPKVIHVKAWTSSQVEWIQSTLRLMAAESREVRPGGATVVTRLADILVIQAIRSWIEQDAAAQSGWLGAFRDKQIGHAIAAIHRDPAQEWTVESLADVAAMSRSAFAARFKELVGEPPMEYVTGWRMRVAAMWLREDGATVADLANRLGYQSEAAFSRAFKRVIGVAPGGVRNRLV